MKLRRRSNGAVLSLTLVHTPRIVALFFLFLLPLYSFLTFLTSNAAHLECTRHSFKLGEQEDNDCEITQFRGGRVLREYQLEVVDLILELSSGEKRIYYDVNAAVHDSSDVAFKRVDINLVQEVTETHHKHMFVKDDSKLHAADAADLASYSKEDFFEDVRSVIRESGLCIVKVMLESNENKRVYPLFKYDCREIVRFLHKTKRTTPNIFGRLREQGGEGNLDSEGGGGEQRPGRRGQRHIHISFQENSLFINSLRKVSGEASGDAGNNGSHKAKMNSYLYSAATSSVKIHLDISLSDFSDGVKLVSIVAFFLLGCVASLLVVREEYEFDTIRGLFSISKKSAINVKIKHKVSDSERTFFFRRLAQQ